MYDKIIVDADLCIKLGVSEKYRFLIEVLPLLSSKIYMHVNAYNEVLTPNSAKTQLQELIDKKVLEIVSEDNLCEEEKNVYQLTYSLLSQVMINPLKPNKNKGETCSLSYAKATKIPIFATDEKHLQPIIDNFLNTGIDNINCLRIVNIIDLAKNNKIKIQRKYAKALWRISSGIKDANEIFDSEIWPI